ncbi:MAG: dihydroorotase [Candidatus Eremiobacteraeota bacterium]|nr:dihydroorotase [Candidatus Eremiobacteraeota bacterium]MBC5826437.1 dihydroorotase [Candidatus Eremiobacteraeota bacterium]
MPLDGGGTKVGRNVDFVGARVVDPSLALDGIRTVVVRNGTIAALLDRAPAASDTSARRIDCAGMVLCPGFIDPHVHLREPGDSHKETLATGLTAAAAGGFTAVAAMPNTRPPIDDGQRVRQLLRDSAAVAAVRCYPIGAVTVAREGRALAPLRSMAAAGAVAFSDDGACTTSLKVLFHAALLAADLPMPFLSHCEDPSFAGAVIHEGETSDRLGLPGSPSLSEAAIAARDILVAQTTGKAWHLCHVSAETTIGVLEWARAQGTRVTAEVTPHHLQCNDEMLSSFDARCRVNPPLRSVQDVAAMRVAVRRGTISIFASDHAPHSEEEKEAPLSHASPGFSGLEVAVAATFDALDGLPLATMVANYSTNVAALLGVPGGSLQVGSPADMTALYLDRPWTVDPTLFVSKGRATPFAGRRFKVRPAMTVVGGCVVFNAAAPTQALPAPAGR